MIRAIAIEGDAAVVAFAAQPTFRDVLSRVSFETGVPVPTIVGPRRIKSAVRARTAVVWAANELLGRSQSSIARQLGGRDHTTIGAAVRRAQRWTVVDPAFVLLTKKLRTHFEGHAA